MREYRVNLVGLNVSKLGTPMQPDERWASAAKAAIELGSAIIDPADYSYMTVEEIVECLIDFDWQRKVGIAYKDNIETAQKLFELLKKVDGDVELTVLFTPTEGISEAHIAGVLNVCRIDSFSVEKLLGEETGILYLSFDYASAGAAAQLFAAEVEEVLNTVVQ